jgi:hypothetical protein
LDIHESAGRVGGGAARKRSNSSAINRPQQELPYKIALSRNDMVAVFGLRFKKRPLLREHRAHLRKAILHGGGFHGGVQNLVEAAAVEPFGIELFDE